MATCCPYCDEVIETAIRNDWAGNYYTSNDEFECPKCGEVYDSRPGRPKEGEIR